VERQEKRKPASLRAVTEPPHAFNPDKEGKLPALSSSTPEASERREALFLWSRFANYMTQKLGSDASSARPSQLSPSALSTASDGKADATFPVVYQRFGNVNAWAFTSGSLQFDFPDHTKVVLSPGGEWIELHHLDPSLSSALHSDLPISSSGSSTSSQTEHAPPSAGIHPTQVPLPPSPGTIKAYRASLRVPTRLFFAGKASENRVLKELARANELKEKLGFVKDVVRMWSRNGGIGNQSSDRLIWGGLGADWIASSSDGGGGRRVGWMGVSL
jgi:hypothetical protein